MMKVCVSIVVFLLLSGVALAQSDDFTVSQQIGNDVTPPTTPTGLTATPIAHTQIDLSWIASTDDEELGGYVVYRDAVQIATTTLTTYSDSGLTASTTYSYFVQAFDVSFNYSSSSNTVATTTFGQPATSTPPTDDSSDADLSIDLISFDIKTDVYSADLQWETNRYARYELRWGRTSSYELGFVINEVYKREHQTMITGLQPGTVYEFELIAYNRDGRAFTLKEGRFTTKSLPDSTPPTNVFGLKGVTDGRDVRLSWTNPLDNDYSYVRIVRSHLFYPTDPYDGFIVYQGNADSFIDRNAHRGNRVLYYTAFAYDDKGNVSSGASIIVYPEDAVTTPGEVEEGGILELTFADFEVLQNEEHVRNGVLEAGVPFLVRIAYEKLPEHLKTITAEFSFPDSEVSQLYLLRINKDKTYYEALIPPLYEKGTYPTTVSIYDHTVKRAHVLKGELFILKGTQAPAIPIFGGLVGNIDQGLIVDLWFFLVLFLLICIVLELLRTLRDTHVRQKMQYGIYFHVMALFILGGAVSYILFSLPSATSVAQQGALMEAVSFETFGTLFVYTLLALLVFIVLVSVALYFKRK